MTRPAPSHDHAARQHASVLGGDGLAQATKEDGRGKPAGRPAPRSNGGLHRCGDKPEVQAG